MKLGIISDSHGHVRRVRQALAVFESAGVDGIIHCGDIGRVEVLEELAGWQCWFVWGNTDLPDPAWRPHVQALGLPWPSGPLDLTLDSKRIAVFHGHERSFRRAITTPNYDYLLHGHTHHRNDHRVGTMRVINPGALCRVLTKTIAILDLAEDHLQFLKLDGRPA